MSISTRTLTFSQHGRDIAVMISIEMPVRGERDWACRYSIAWPDGLHTGSGFGLDSTQALLLAMEAVGADIYTSEFHRSGQLKWLEAQDGYGFPVPKTIRHLLIGGDAIHAGLDS